MTDIDIYDPTDEEWEDYCKMANQDDLIYEKQEKLPDDPEETNCELCCEYCNDNHNICDREDGMSVRGGVDTASCGTERSISAELDTLYGKINFKVVIK